MQPSIAANLEVDCATLQRRLSSVPRLVLAESPTAVHRMAHLRTALGGGPTLLIKRDDLISFACGGNKVRKLEMVAAAAVAAGADTLVSMGGLQSNHARATAAVAARLGMACVLVLNGSPQEQGATGNARLIGLFGARIEYVARREDRQRRMLEIAADLEAAGRRPFLVSLGASTGLGALGYIQAVDELLAQVPPPDAIIVAASSGGTLAGLAGGLLLHGAPTRVMAVSADDAADEIAGTAARLLNEAGELLDAGGTLARPDMFEVDDHFVGAGYAIPTPASREAAALAAATEGLVLDPVYTAKAMAALIAYVQRGRFSPDQTVLFWHTGGVPGYFA